jgi:predicted DNA-binding WGR domain protein
MLEFFKIALEAHHDVLNHHRYYEISVGRDLLHDWIVTIHYSRVGQRGQERRFGSPHKELMQRVVREHLRRRLSAPKRIGCSYQIRAINTTPCSDTTGWLPPDVVAGFR